MAPTIILTNEKAEGDPTPFSGGAATAGGSGAGSNDGHGGKETSQFLQEKMHQQVMTTTNFLFNKNLNFD